MNHLKLDVRLTLKTPLHTTGNRWVWQADKASAQSADGLFVVPATTLKGVLRANAETILKTWGVSVCTGPNPGTMCADLAHLCPVCRVFGNPRRRTPLKFRDARLPPNESNSQIRSGVGISRQRQAAIAQHLFFIETVTGVEGHEWLTIWDGYYAQQKDALETVALVYLAAGLGQIIGSGGSRGLGWINKWQIQAMINQEAVSEESLTSCWQAWAKGT
jgi:CRISPR/Cas system CSM-associated protein Csm3 (group 7 of RAMP superfamily)